MDMKTCQDTTLLLPELWVAHKLAPEAAAAFEEHLMTCAVCQDAVTAARGLRQGLALVAAEQAAKAPAESLRPVARRLLAFAALVPLAIAAIYFAGESSKQSERAERAQLEVARLERAAKEAQQEGSREQELRRQAEERGQKLEQELQAREQVVPAATTLAPLVDLPTFLLAVVRDRPQGPDLVLHRSRLGEAFNLALDLPDPSFTRFRIEISGPQGQKLLTRQKLESSALGALVLTLPADFLPEGESRVLLYGEGPGRSEQELARFRIALEP